MGGSIAPGSHIATEALFQRASTLPLLELGVPESAIGRNTVHSMQAGILYGYVALVDGLVERIKRELDYQPKVIATGGLANVIAAHTRSIEKVDDFLTLEGLRLIYRRNA